MPNLGKIDKKAQGTAKDAGLQGSLGNTTQTCPAPQLELGVFFDGTNNNLNNSNIGRDIEVLETTRTVSYKNNLSNPALLFQIYKNGPEYNELNDCGGVGRKFDSLYIDGIGSTGGQEDDRVGYVFGMRSTGIEARVVEAFEQTLKKISNAGGYQNLSKLVLDVFGFSRGAAAARYYVNCVRQRTVYYAPVWANPLQIDLPKELEIEIRFVGIFDTVAAFGIIPNNSINRPVNLYLDEAKQVTKKIYHITARNEYRTNFRLNLNTPGGGDTHELPGAHSDIGGGYRYHGDRAPLGNQITRSFNTREEAERAHLITHRKNMAPKSNAREEAIFVNEGWMNAYEPEGGIINGMSEIVTETVIDRSHPGSPRPKTVYKYNEKKILYRPWVQIGLSRVALHMMYEKAVQYVDGALMEMPTGNEEYEIPSDLQQYVPAMKAGTLSEAERRFILRNFGHVSMKDGTPISLNPGSPFINEDWWGHRPTYDHNRVKYDNYPELAI